MRNNQNGNAIEIFITLTRCNTRQQREEDAVCRVPHQTCEYGTRLFKRWVQEQGSSPDATGSSKNALDPLKNANRMLQAPGNKTGPSKED